VACDPQAWLDVRLLFSSHLRLRLNRLLSPTYRCRRYWALKLRLKKWKTMNKEEMIR
jgi:hypothetical protein